MSLLVARRRQVRGIVRNSISCAIQELADAILKQRRNHRRWAPSPQSRCAVAQDADERNVLSNTLAADKQRPFPCELPRRCVLALGRSQTLQLQSSPQRKQEASFTAIHFRS